MSPVVATIGPHEFIIPLKTAAEWYAEQLAKENRP